MAFLANLLHRDPVVEGFHVIGGTHVGLVRSSNEDSYLYVNSPWSNAVLVAVADGMGGHEFGEVASFLVMRYVLDCWNHRGDKPFESREDATSFMHDALHRANAHIYHVNRELKIHMCMGTTVTMGVFFQNKLVVAQVGDSRCYRTRKKKMKLLTVDQNWREEMVQNGIMTDEEAANHPLSNMLTNCVGAMKTLKIEYVVETVHPGDRYLFCTDGLNSVVKDERIARIVRDSKLPQYGVEELIKHALRCGGTDNITTICLYS